MSIFTGVENAKASEGGVYFLPGVYKVEIRDCKSGRTRKGIPFCVVECRVIESNNAARPAGSDCSWFVGMDKDAALGNIKAFMATITGEDKEEIDVQSCEYVFSDAGRKVYEGKQFTVTAANVPTKAGKDFTRLSWS